MGPGHSCGIGVGGDIGRGKGRWREEAQWASAIGLVWGGMGSVGVYLTACRFFCVGMEWGGALYGWLVIVLVHFSWGCLECGIGVGRNRGRGGFERLFAWIGRLRILLVRVAWDWVRSV